MGQEFVSFPQWVSEKSFYSISVFVLISLFCFCLVADSAASQASKKNNLSIMGNFKIPKPKRLDFQATTDNEPENRQNTRSTFNNFSADDSVQLVDSISEPDIITEHEAQQHVEQTEEEEQVKQLDSPAVTRKLPNQNIERVLQEGICICICITDIKQLPFLSY